MLRNYFLIACRILTRQLSFSLINIFGLALGIASSLVITLYVYKELDHDQNFKDGDRIYRVATSFFNLGNFAKGPDHLNDRISQYPEIELTARLKNISDVLIKSPTMEQIENNIYRVDSTFFQIFQFPFIAGNPATCLNDPASIVISEMVARKYFGTTDVLGKILLIGKEKEPMQVTGVIKNTSEPMHFGSEIWARFNPPNPVNTNWNSASAYNYIKLKTGTSKFDLEERIKQIIKTEVYPIQGGGKTYEEWVETDNAYKLFVQPLHDIYLHSKLKYELSEGGNLNNLYIFSGVAALILILAMVNFINLSTARAGKRAKEVGLRKTLGTSRQALIKQFLLESVLMCLLALALSLFLAQIFLVGYHLIVGQELLSSIFTNWKALLGALLFSGILGLLAGLYPAIYLTSFEPAKVLKGSFYSGRKSRLRDALVVFQFTISVCITVFIIIILEQVKFLQNKDLGFDDENILVIENARQLANNKIAFRNQMDQLSQVKSSCFTSNPPAGNSVWFYTFQTKQMQESVSFNTIPGDDRLLETFGIKLLEGRNFNPKTDTGFTAAILNESAVRDLMLGDPIGAEINKGQKVIGVVSDFHFKAVQNKIEPVVLVFKEDGYNIVFKLSGNIPGFIASAEKAWKQFSPDEPMKYSFVDENFTRQLEKERAFGKIIGFFSVLAIFISCLGLLGLSLYSTEQRTKEIGIRKVLGASVSSIFLLLNKSFMRLVITALIIGTPLTIYFTNQWLANFAYRINLSWEVFVITSGIMIVMALFTVAGSSIRVALKNPVDTLKYE